MTHFLSVKITAKTTVLDAIEGMPQVCYCKKEMRNSIIYRISKQKGRNHVRNECQRDFSLKLCLHSNATNIKLATFPKDALALTLQKNERRSIITNIILISFLLLSGCLGSTDGDAEGAKTTVEDQCPHLQSRDWLTKEAICSLGQSFLCAELNGPHHHQINNSNNTSTAVQTPQMGSLIA